VTPALAAAGLVLGGLLVLGGVFLLATLLWGVLFGLAALLILGGGALAALCLLAPVRPVPTGRGSRT
jgi:hypothetical protein